MSAETPRLDRGAPEGDEIFLDHIGYYVADLGESAQRLQRLGFRITPIKVHYNAEEAGALVPTGTSNWSASFEHGFIEALAATSETPLAARLREGLARYQGVHVIALSHADMAAQRARLIGAGFAMQPVVDLRLPFATPEGERSFAYSVLRTEPGEMPEGRVQMVTDHSPELSQAPSMTVHENRVDALTDLLICVEDPVEAAARFGRFSGRAPESVDGFDAIALDRGRILFLGPSGAAEVLPGLVLPELPYIAGLALRSAELGMTRRVLARHGIEPVAADDGLICVGPQDALGAYLLFHAASVGAPWQDLATRL